MQKLSLPSIVILSVFGALLTWTIIQNKIPILCDACEPPVSDKNWVFKCTPKSGSGSSYCSATKTLNVINGSIVEIISVTRDELVTILSNIPETIKNTIVQVYDLLKGLLATLFQDIKAFQQALIEQVSSILAQAFKAVQEVALSVYATVVKPAVQYVQTYIIEPLKLLLTKLLELKDVIRSTIESLLLQSGEYSKETVSTILDGIDTTLNALPDTINQVIQGLVSSVNETQTTVVSGMNTGIGQIFDTSQSTINTTLSAVEGLFTSSSKATESGINSGLSNAQTGINTSISGINKAINTMNSGLTTVNSSISTVESAVNTVKSSVNTMQTTVDKVNTTVNTLNSTVTSSITKINASLSTMDTLLNSLKNNYNKMVGGWNDMRDYKLKDKFAGITVNFGKPFSFLPSLSTLGSTGKVDISDNNEPLVLKCSSEKGCEFKIGSRTIRSKKAILCVRCDKSSYQIKEIIEYSIDETQEISYDPQTEYLCIGICESEKKCSVHMNMGNETISKENTSGKVVLKIYPDYYFLKPYIHIDEKTSDISFTHGPVQILGKHAMFVQYDPIANIPLAFYRDGSIPENLSDLYGYLIEGKDVSYISSSHQPQGAGAIPSIPTISNVSLPSVKLPTTNMTLPRVDFTSDKKQSQVPSPNPIQIGDVKFNVDLKSIVLEAGDKVVAQLKSMYIDMITPLKTSITAITTLIVQIFQAFKSFLIKYVSLEGLCQLIPSGGFTDVSQQQLSQGISMVLLGAESNSSSNKSIPEPECTWSGLLSRLTSGVWGQILSAVREYILPVIIEYGLKLWNQIKIVYNQVRSLIVQGLVKIGELLKQAFAYVKEYGLKAAKKVVEASGYTILYYLQKLSDYLFGFIPSSTTRVNLGAFLVIAIIIFVIFGPHTDLIIRRFTSLPDTIRYSILAGLGGLWMTGLVIQDVDMIKKTTQTSSSLL